MIVVNTFNNQSTIISFSKDNDEINKIEKLIFNKAISNFNFKKVGDIKSTNTKDH